MKTTRVAVASRNGRTVAGHIGKCAHWIVYEALAGNAPEDEPVVTEVERITLPKDLIFHHYHDERPHPLRNCVAVIGASAGESFVKKMRNRGIEAVLTAESDPGTAVADFVRSNVTPARSRPIGGLICKIRDAFASDH